MTNATDALLESCVEAIAANLTPQRYGLDMKVKPDGPMMTYSDHQRIIEGIERALRNPVTVRVAMLRGQIATPAGSASGWAHRFDPSVQQIGGGDSEPYMTPSPDGDYVRHTDYAALQAEVARLAEERDHFKFNAERLARDKTFERTRAEAAEAEAATLRERLAAQEADARRYRWIRDSQACSLSLSHNDHHAVYEPVESVLSRDVDPSSDYYGDVPADERDRMIAADSIWTLHIYPNSPVGFNVYHGATLDTAIDAAMGSANGQG